MTERTDRFIHRPVRTGALTLLIAAVLICLAVLAVLALATAKADLAMAERSLAGLQKQAALETAGQQCLADLDAAIKEEGKLPDGAVRLDDGSITDSVTLEGDTLQISLRPKSSAGTDPAAYTITAWRIITAWEPDQTLDLWNGM